MVPAPDTNESASPPEGDDHTLYFKHPNTGLQEDLEEALMGPIIGSVYNHLTD